MRKSIKNIIETIIFPEGTAHRLLPLYASPCTLLREAQFSMGGLSEAPEGYYVERRNPKSHEILFTFGGTGHLSSGNSEFEVLPNTVMILPARSTYRYRCVTPPWRIMWTHFHDEEPWTVLRNLNCHVREATMMDELLHATEGILAESVRGDGITSGIMKAYSELILLFTKRELHAGENLREHKASQLLHSLWSEISAHLEEDWPVERMAAHLFMSPANFYRLCVRHTGFSPVQILFRLRMSHAEILLTQYGYPLKTVAEHVGYGTPFAFSNAFKRYKGVSPKKYRRTPTSTTKG
jgi:AraC-like DNA-binding protein